MSCAEAGSTAQDVCGMRRSWNVLRLSARHLEQLTRHVASAIPGEACGFLGGMDGRVVAVIPVPNIAPDPAREFMMEPQAQWKAMENMAERGWQMLAIYHSHPPGGRAEPSASDIATAYYPEALILVVVPDWAGNVASLRAFAIDSSQVCEVSIALES